MLSFNLLSVTPYSSVNPRCYNGVKPSKPFQIIKLRFWDGISETIVHLDRNLCHSDVYLRANIDVVKTRFKRNKKLYTWAHERLG